MRAVVQRVSSSKVTVDGEVTGEINKGLLVLLGVTHEDTSKDVDYIIDKVLNLRIFEDENEKMNLSLKHIFYLFSNDNQINVRELKDFQNFRLLFTSKN